MSEIATSSLTRCTFECTDCFAYKDKDGAGRCTCLSNTDFRGKPCPFYATKEAAEASRRKARERLVSMGMPDLLEKYLTAAKK